MPGCLALLASIYTIITHLHDRFADLFARCNYSLLSRIAADLYLIFGYQQTEFDTLMRTDLAGLVQRLYLKAERPAVIDSCHLRVIRTRYNHRQRENCLTCNGAGTDRRCSHRRFLWRNDRFVRRYWWWNTPCQGC